MNKSIFIIIFTFTFSISAFSKRPYNYNLNYKKTIQNTAAMVSNSQAWSFARKYGLNILNVTWEDTGRYKGSSVGPNISDMTIQVQYKDPKTRKYQLFCMPVIRYPNFSDKTADIRPENFNLLVGNEKGKSLKKVSLKDYLDNIRKYMSDPGSWKGRKKSLLARRDSHVLVSAQFCFLPIPKRGKAEFNPVIFNYQSYAGDPAVLTILATREGTSATVIDNKRDGFTAGRTWGQRLFFNQNGERASLTGQRISDFRSGNNTKSIYNTVQAGDEKGLNMVLLIQVPLKQKSPMRYKYSLGDSDVMYSASEKKSARRSDVENAVIGHGKVEGPYTEIDDLDIERDPRYPIRVTVQFYKATSNGIVNDYVMKEISDQIKKVYSNADYVGSLVTDGDTGRPTEYDGPKFEPPDWWDKFWKRNQANTGLTPEETITMLKKLYGPNWKPISPWHLKREMRNLEKK